MFSDSTDLYDVIYGSWKDYGAESAKVAALIRERRAEARRVLDVGCGTGMHAKLLAEQHGFEVDGLDVEPEFVRSAQERHPTGRFFCGDMARFSLDRRYDAIICLFSSIGYVCTVGNLKRTFERFREHLGPEGVVLVEPWFTPDAWLPGHVNVATAEGNGLKVCRMSRASRDGRLAILEFEYLIGRSEGIERRREVHQMGLFDVVEMTEGFVQAGLRVEYDPVGLTGRGLYLGTPEG